ncbi:MAG TPA: serine hydrolase, partial [Paracoccus sp. (in: a-proteobacteria)]|nr:serine hydrolase [Paracoccus sp. (in: a-proteobacteria)]
LYSNTNFLLLGLIVEHLTKQTLGEVLRERFRGWRVGIVTSDGQLARATGLPLREPGPYIAHGGLKIRLYQTGPL